MALAVAGCTECDRSDDATAQGRAEQVSELPAVAGPVEAVWSLAVDPHVGLSGLTSDGDARFWSVPERGRALLPLAYANERLRPKGETIAVEGLPDGLDLESISWLGDDRFAIGTESSAKRAEDHVLWVELVQQPGSPFRVVVPDKQQVPAGGRARVTGSLPVRHGMWGLQAEPNRGIEGLCAVGDQLIVALESVHTVGKTRRAPVGVYDMQRASWRALWLPLSSESGKLAALDCRPHADGGVEVLAVERHFGMSRLVQFHVPGSDDPAPKRGELTGQLRVDLAQHVDPLPNFEGLVWRGDHAYLISDNHYGRRTGPTLAVRVRLPTP